MEKDRAYDDDDELGDNDRLVRRGRFPSRSPTRVPARSSRARSSGLQRPRPPEAGASKVPPWQADRPDAPPGRDRLRGQSPQED
eukprot:5333466-Pyramimonas_sp.AAC.1